MYSSSVRQGHDGMDVRLPASKERIVGMKVHVGETTHSCHREYDCEHSIRICAHTQDEI